MGSGSAQPARAHGRGQIVVQSTLSPKFLWVLEGKFLWVLEGKTNAAIPRDDPRANLKANLKANPKANPRANPRANPPTQGHPERRAPAGPDGVQGARASASAI
jgi:hypothetical protein